MIIVVFRVVEDVWELKEIMIGYNFRRKIENGDLYLEFNRFLI